MFKVNNIVNIVNIFSSNVSIVNFEHVIAGWDRNGPLSFFIIIVYTDSI